MTKEKLLAAIAWMKQSLGGELIDGRPLDPGNSHPTEDELQEHLIFMCDQANTFVQQERLEKAMRWLGFIQGALFATGKLSIGDFRVINNLYLHFMTSCFRTSE